MTVFVKILVGPGSNASNPVAVPVTSLDTLMDVRQSLVELPETACYTHYMFRCKGKDLNDFTEVSSTHSQRHAPLTHRDMLH